ncbi:hypothetical protein F5X96DRAFT_670927 [Biscogniauxia mediterranea]|nr:hypothetical protein F5X96DRAFT_670927 [Biscogniauxia mediterranea]
MLKRAWAGFQSLKYVKVIVTKLDCPVYPSPIPRRPYVFTNANVIDVVAGIVRENSTVRISDGQITSITNAGATLLQRRATTPMSLTYRDGTSHRVRSTAMCTSWLCLARATLKRPSTTPTTSLCSAALGVRADAPPGFTTVRDCGDATSCGVTRISVSVLESPLLLFLVCLEG